MTPTNRLLPVIRTDDTTLLEGAHRQLCQQYQDLMQQVDAFDRAMREELHDLIAYHQRLQAVMREVDAKARAAAQEASCAGATPSPDPSPAPAPETAAEAAPEAAAAPEIEPLKKQCAKVFKKIARRCHPDKTRDTALHELFLRARRAYERRDLPQLRQLHDLLLRGGRLSMQRDTRAELEAKIRDLHWQIACLVHSDVYTLTLVWQSNHRHALQHMAQQILAQVGQLRTQLYLLTGQFF